MSATNENIEELVDRARRLCLTISEGVAQGFITDEGGTLQEQAHAVVAAARTVEWDLNPDDEKSFIGGEDDHLEAQVENDLGDEFSHGLGEIDGGGE